MSTIRLDQLSWLTNQMTSSEIDINPSSTLILEPFTTTRLVIQDPAVIEYLPLLFLNTPNVNKKSFEFSIDLLSEIERTQYLIEDHFNGWHDVDRLLYVNDDPWFVLPGSTGAVPLRDWERWATFAFSESASRTSGVDKCSIGPVSKSTVLEWHSVDESEFEYRIYTFSGSITEDVSEWIKSNSLRTMLSFTWELSSVPLFERLFVTAATSSANRMLNADEILPEIDLESRDWGIGLTSTSEWSCRINLDEKVRSELLEGLRGQYWNDDLALIRELREKQDSQNHILRVGSNKSPVVLHVPHSSTFIPSAVIASLKVQEDTLAYELLQMTDSYTDAIARVAFEKATCSPWIFENSISRLVIDPERFPDEREVMERVGMGAVYSKTHDLKILRDISATEKEDLLQQFFYPYAEQLSQLVLNRLEACGSALIIDVHSYPSHKLPYEIDTTGIRPAICLGVDDFHTSNDLINKASEVFSQFGDVAINSPFSGTYVPLDFYGTDRRVQSLMIEIRRDVYMDEISGIPKFEVLQELGIAISKLIDSVSDNGGHDAITNK